MRRKDAIVKPKEGGIFTEKQSNDVGCGYVKKNVDDRGSTPQAPGYKIVSSWIKSSVRDFLVCVKVKIGEKGYCHFCGTSGLIVEKFPRRGYGKRTLSAGIPGL